MPEIRTLFSVQHSDRFNLSKLIPDLCLQLFIYALKLNFVIIMVFL